MGQKHLSRFILQQTKCVQVQVQVFFSGTLSNFSVPEFKKLTWWEVRLKAAGKTVFHGTTEGLHCGDRQTKCFFVDRQSNMWCFEEDQLRCLRNGRTKCSLTVSCRRPGKLGSRSNSLCFCAAHTSSHVSSEFYTFTCLLGHVCATSSPVVCQEVWNMVKNSQVTIDHALVCNIHTLGLTTLLRNENCWDLHKVECSTSRYFENSQSLWFWKLQRLSKYHNLCKFSIPNDSQKFLHFFDCVPARGCVFTLFRSNVAFPSFAPSTNNHHDVVWGGQTEGFAGEYDKTVRN